MNRRILIASCVHRTLDAPFLTGLNAVLANKYDGIEVLFQLLVGLPVNFARNHLAGYAKTVGAREILFIDSDMGWEEEDFVRIVSHKDVDIVGNLYCRKELGRPHYHVNLKEGCDPDEKTGLCEVEAIATGFLKIRVDTVFPAMEKKFPERAYDNMGGGFEYFPMGCVGPRTAEAKLAKIEAIFAAQPNGTVMNQAEQFEALAKAVRALREPQPPSTMLGEDVFFCRLARECGFKVYADFGARVIPHWGAVPFPLPEEAA